MQIVIELDEILYGEFLTYGIVGLNVDNQIEISKAIRKGKPLPEHHGRLIDADALTEKAPEIQEYLDVLAPTIIEADEEKQDARI